MFQIIDLCQLPPKSTIPTRIVFSLNVNNVTNSGGASGKTELVRGSVTVDWSEPDVK